MATEAKKLQPIIIKRVKKGGHSAHGGAHALPPVLGCWACPGLGVRVAWWGRCAEGLSARHARCRRQPWQAELLRAFSAHETELTWDDVRWRGPAPKRRRRAAVRAGRRRRARPCGSLVQERVSCTAQGRKSASQRLPGKTG